MTDPDIAGTELDTVRFPVERSKLAELARAFQDDDPAWFDPTAARAAGFARIPAPPTATVLADHWRSDGALTGALALGLDVARLLHGEASWEYLVPVRAGDELASTARVVDVTTREGRRGGTMTLITIETAFTNQDGAVAVIRRDTLIETAPPA
jgi:acyl dehydratase